jgi:hypothetical protein
MAMEGLSRDTATVVKAPEEAKVMAMMTAAWRVGSVLISNTNFMPKNCGEGGNCINFFLKSVLEKSTTRDNAANEFTTAASPWFLGVGKNLVVRK